MKSIHFSIVKDYLSLLYYKIVNFINKRIIVYLGCKDHSVSKKMGKRFNRLIKSISVYNFVSTTILILGWIWAIKNNVDLTFYFGMLAIVSSFIANVVMDMEK